MRKLWSDVEKLWDSLPDSKWIVTFLIGTLFLSAGWNSWEEHGNLGSFFLWIYAQILYAGILVVVIIPCIVGEQVYRRSQNKPLAWVIGILVLVVLGGVYGAATDSKDIKWRLDSIRGHTDDD